MSSAEKRKKQCKLHVKLKKHATPHKEMNKNKEVLLKLQNMDYGYINSDLMEKIYKTYTFELSLTNKISFHEERIAREKVILEG